MTEQQRFELFDHQLWRHRRTLEYEIFTIITKQVSEKKREYCRCSVADCWGIRAYVPVKRYSDDIDIAFPSDLPFDSVFKIAQSCTDYREIAPMPSPNKSIRIRYQTLAKQNIGLIPEFSIHLHSGGVWYEKKLFNLDDIFFDSVRWLDIPSAADTMVSLPIPKLEELFLLKADKFLGNDKIDVLSMLSIPTLDLAYIKDRARILDKNNMVFANLEKIKADYDYLINDWSLEHLSNISKGAEDMINFNLINLLEGFKCPQ